MAGVLFTENAKNAKNIHQLFKFSIGHVNVYLNLMSVPSSVPNYVYWCITNMYMIGCAWKVMVA